MPVTLDILEVGARGDGVAELDGQRYFVAFTLPGETVTCPCAENFSHDVSENRIRSLPYVNRTAHHTDAALTIEPKLNARLRHVVPIDWQASAADV